MCAAVRTSNNHTKGLDNQSALTLSAHDFKTHWRSSTRPGSETAKRRTPGCDNSQGALRQLLVRTELHAVKPSRDHRNWELRSAARFNASIVTLLPWHGNSGSDFQGMTPSTGTSQRLAIWTGFWFSSEIS